MALDITKKAVVDQSITKKDYYNYIPYTSSYNNSDSIRICIQNQELNVLPCESDLLITGTITKNDSSVHAAGDAKPKFVNNGILFCFDSIRYELNGVEIDCTRNLGQAITMKGSASYNTNEIQCLKSAGWINDEGKYENNFNYCIPLKTLLGFCEDFKTMVVNAKHEIILIRSNSDANAIIADAENVECKINITKIVWRVPHITLSDEMKLEYLSVLKRKTPLQIAFRTWEMYEYPLLPRNSHEFWRIKTSSQTEKPRFLILGFQTDRKDKKIKSLAKFDNCNLHDLKVHLNSETIPYESMSLDYDKNLYAILYKMYSDFRSSYYGLPEILPQPFLSFDEFKNNQLVVIDCKHQLETLRDTPVDVRVEIKTSKTIPAQTSLHCMIISERMYEYSPSTSEVRKLN